MALSLVKVLRIKCKSSPILQIYTWVQITTIILHINETISWFFFNKMGFFDNLDNMAKNEF